MVDRFRAIKALPKPEWLKGQEENPEIRRERERMEAGGRNPALVLTETGFVDLVTNLAAARAAWDGLSRVIEPSNEGGDNVSTVFRQDRDVPVEPKVIVDMDAAGPAMPGDTLFGVSILPKTVHVDAEIKLGEGQLQILEGSSFLIAGWYKSGDLRINVQKDLLEDGSIQYQFRICDSSGLEILNWEDLDLQEVFSQAELI